MSNRDYNMLLKLKIELLLNGLNFSDTEVQDYLVTVSNGSKEASHGLFNYHDTNKFVPNEIIAEYNGNKIRIETRSNKNSKFTLYIKNDSLYLNYEDIEINIIVDKLPNFLNKLSPLGVPLKKYVNIMGKDCLRIYPKLHCDFDRPDIKCKFCGVNAIKDSLNDDVLLSEYLWAFDIANEEYKPNYIFMSTGTHFNIEEYVFFEKLIKEIKKRKNGTILLKNTVFVPAQNIPLNLINKFYNIGLGMISINIEIWDEILFKDLCPGKEKIFGRDKYIEMFDTLCSRYEKGFVKTNFVLGLESIGTLKEGIEYLAKKGCFSSGTIFYPTPGAILNKDYQNKNIDYYIEVYKFIYEMAKKYDLKIPWSKDNRISGLEWDIQEYEV